jgi:hypothetical protein
MLVIIASESSLLNNLIETDGAAGVASKLRRQCDGQRATEIIMEWAGARKRAANKWPTGPSGPTREHLTSLVRDDDRDAVLEILLRLSRREASLVSGTPADAESQFAQVFGSIDDPLAGGPRQQPFH